MAENTTFQFSVRLSLSGMQTQTSTIRLDSDILAGTAKNTMFSGMAITYLDFHHSINSGLEVNIPSLKSLPVLHRQFPQERKDFLPQSLSGTLYGHIPEMHLFLSKFHILS